MARRWHQLFSLLKTARLSLRGEDRAAIPRRAKTPLKHLLTAWAGAVVLAINLFGWTGTSLSDASPQAMDMAMLDGTPLCEHVQHHSPQDQRGNADHGKMVCPACFPLGNASSGALTSGPPTAQTVAAPLVVERALPPDRRAPSSFVPHRYQARAPPRPA
ncbi:hypothetical protein [Telmatospirillum siberiense]|uniref:DUF2946 domain-containing protein n=1 Tax=Telmatospirillum siberiense TaxID=382514 RepID=A0A2N3PLS3_9PROT|nr:hypothetical protein [Telmatospirillum siberiense]PKU21344.1 hypothetical protein CWS72_27235 [Telmatospirillum siberiense]